MIILDLDETLVHCNDNISEPCDIKFDIHMDTEII